jgi:3-hydroxymyristoyl/3-hydroxydecanoyl-(acyl carrier protein) dehydratase
LARLVRLRIIEKEPKAPYYRRNEAYLEWRVLLHIVEEYSMDEIIERVEALESRQEDLVGNTGEIPTVVPASDVKMHERVGPRMEAANELERVKRRIRLYELARQVLQNDGHLVSEPL